MRNKNNLKKLLILVILLIQLVPWIVQAQEITTQGTVYNLRTSTFPVIQFSMDVMDGTGNFITDLQTNDVTILEDDKETPPTEVKAYDPGMELVVGINPNFSFSIMDNQARSRLDKIKDALTSWSSDLIQSSNHAYSLVTPDGPAAFHVKDLNSWLTGLAAWQPPMKTMEPSLDILAQSIDLASTSLLEPGARRVVLFITPLAEKEDAATLESLTEKAKQLDVHVFLWVVAPPDTGPTTGLIAQQNLADETGGSLVLYSGDSDLPGASETLAPLQTSYRVTYNSSVRTSGEHTLSVQLKTTGEPISLTPLSFDLDVEAPNPILVSPPDQITRQFPGGGDFNPDSLTPTSQEIEMIVEFPDGHPRTLTSTSLLVDGKVVATNTSEPFYVFNWDLMSYTTESRLNLQVKVVDSLGLEKTSISIPVTISVEETPSIFSIYYQQFRQWIILSIGLLAAILLAWRLIRLIKMLKRRRKISTNETQPLPLEDDLKDRDNKVPASLEPFPQFESSTNQKPIPLSAKEIRIGSDPKKVNIVLEDASVGDIHVLIRRNGETFFAIDMGSASGTWVNYEKIGEEPKRLFDGDIIHIGAMAYRFQLNDSGEKKEPRIVRLE
ncbi:MAG: FHA domain-containing protein [Anaerolineales bacterium]